jgi:hypothetical protein
MTICNFGFKDEALSRATRALRSIRAFRSPVRKSQAVSTSLAFAFASAREARHLRVARKASPAGRALGAADETRSASQKIKHLYSAEIFQRRLDSFLISFMAGRNV